MVETVLPSHPIPIVSVAGRPKVGKTTFLVKLIAELKQRGYRIGIIKHSVHSFAMDKEGKDTWKHLQAGADAVAFVSPHHLSLIRCFKCSVVCLTNLLYSRLDVFDDVARTGATSPLPRHHKLQCYGWVCWRPGTTPPLAT